MPDSAHGLELVRRLSRDHRIPVLGLSAQARLRDAALVAGASGFIDKGSTPGAVLDAVRAAAGTPMLLTDAHVSDHRAVEDVDPRPISYHSRGQKPIRYRKHRLDTQRREGRPGRVPPVARILLGPARPRRRKRVAGPGARDDRAVRRDRERLDAGRPDVEADEIHAPRAAYTSS